MHIGDQEIFHPEKLYWARFVSHIAGHYMPSPKANRYIVHDKIRSILVQEHQCIGDVLMLIPTLKALKANYPNARIDLLCTPAVRELAEKGRLADTVLSFPKQTPLHTPYDMVFDFHGDVRRLKLLRKYKSKYRCGFTFSGGAAWLTHLAEYPYKKHQVERPFDLLSQLNIPIPERTPRLALFPDTEKPADRLLPHPGANHPQRRWPAERWLALKDELSAQGFEVRWIAPPGEKVPAGVAPVSGSLFELAGLIARSNLLIGCDSMAVHLAAALGTHALAIFGSQDPGLTQPYGPFGHVISPEVPCRHRRSDWRLCGQCMATIGVKDVAQAALAILRE
ncbi:MAG: glycosyltransferase family 9 protein [Candidatus Marinimicrobia bacterium]|nr:glycosyltransferase family 9 protein [Candidatus Neomarinimicrobiota bacterium]